MLPHLAPRRNALIPRLLHSLIVLIALGMIGALIIFKDALANIYGAVTGTMEAQLPGEDPPPGN